MLEMEQTDSSKLVQMNTHGEDEGSHGSYLKFFVMIGASMVIMYLLTYLNSYQIIEHAHFSETRLYMTTLMGGAMMAIMLFFMLGMYKNSKANSAIFVAAGLLMLLSIWLVRSQITVNGVDYMEAMIPHHSIAILTSERAGIEDPRVRELADQIIEAQRKEIKEMEWLIDDIKTNGLARTEEEAAARPVPQFTASP
jgi:FlaA1/EpsC-like NDP-sugar epimerase